MPTIHEFNGFEFILKQDYLEMVKRYEDKLSALQSIGAVANEPPTQAAAKLPQLEDVKREAFAEMSATYGMPATNSEIVSMVYGIIERQLRAGA
jgi:hypothetical protein